MGKKYKDKEKKTETPDEVWAKISENSAETNSGENTENQEAAEEAVKSIFNGTDEDLSGYTELADKVLAEIMSLPNGEERSRAIKDLELVAKVIRDGYTNQNEAEKMKLETELKQAQLEREILIKQKEIEIKERELALKELEQRAREFDQTLHEEEIKTSKRSIFVQAFTTFLTMAGSMFGYGLLLNRQNEFEREDPYTTQGSKSLVSNISKLPRLKG